MHRKEGKAHYERGEGVVGLGNGGQAPSRGADVDHPRCGGLLEEGEEGIGGAGGAKGVDFECLPENGAQAERGDGGFVCHTGVVLHGKFEVSVHLNRDQAGKDRETHDKYVQSLPV